MIKLNLKKLCKVLELTPLPKDNLTIEYVTDDIKKIDNDTLVFYLNKDCKIDVTKYNQLKDCFIVTDQPVLKELNLNCNQFFFVSDVHDTYHNFIDYYRGLLHIPIVAITGTCGKTTTKEMIRQVLLSNHQVVATDSSINALRFNHNYLMQIDEKTEFAVFETAISKPGYLIAGCNYYKPTIGVITNIGFDHLDGFSTFESYILTKGEMLAGLQYKGCLLINLDDENSQRIDYSPFKGRIITFGLNNQADFYASHIIYKDEGMEFILNYNNNQYTVYIPLFGTHNVYNALAALAVLNELGLEFTESISRLATITPIRSHLEFHKGMNGSILVDDTWSSNPPSIKAAFEVINQKGKEKIKIAVFGKLSSQGDFSEEQFDSIAKLVLENKIDFLITKSSISNRMARKVREYGMDQNRVIHCKDNEELIQTLSCLLDSNTIVLFKNSMFDKSLDSVLEHFIKRV